MAWVFCSREDVASLTPAAVSALPDFWSETVEAMIRAHLGMPHLGVQALVTNELHNGSGTNIILVSKPPIVSVQTVAVVGFALMESEYIVTRNSVQLRYTVFPQGTLNIGITYTSGSELDADSVPVIDPVIRMTAVAMIAALWNYRGRGGADASLKWGDLSSMEGDETPNLKVGLTSHLHTIMKRMLKRGKVRVR